ncbi:MULTISPECIES: glycosyltransferase family 9 protein [Tatumella]|uniref:Glycosyltransferase family 9 protein n=1 Tax=Tatumella punctata TaxID=399969 RepID=A0ABW1VRX8_9GAMM|nr:MULTISPECIES: glycosyltransferase family 9 protein [unclassified Tatumella]MBS0856615.1 glycosyltransferase family 9 protein [Tatumella sp. JGM16]MBS0893849.1 glycosyltransferase family 9 protein [Tatumella sp. JGM130]MBS0913461.1 glycosyltransferase family 9 protein [Tatumella sp. JGM91]
MRESKKKKIGLVDLWLSLFHRHSLGTDEKRRQLAQRTFNSILVYSTTALGDYMFNSPALRAIRQRYPQAHIVLVAHPKYKQLLTRRDFCDDVLFWNNKFSTVTEFARRAKVFAPEMAIMLHSHLPYDVLSAAMSGCRYLVRDNYGKDIGRLSRWLTFGLDQCPGHIINRKMQLVSALGCNTDNVDMAVPCDYTPQAKDAGIYRVGFQLGASTKIRCWPPQYFAGLAERIVHQYPGTEIVLIGSPAEVSLAEEVFACASPDVKTAITSYVGKTSLPELLGIISSMDILVTGDTGPLHLALALKTPTLSLFVSESPHSSGPYQDKHLHRYIYLPMEDPRVTDQQEPLRAIPVEDVFGMLVRMKETHQPQDKS